MSAIWESTDGCDEQYRCASALYLMSVMSQCYSVIINWGISAPGHGKEVVDGLNAIHKHYIYQLMSNVKLSGSKIWLPDTTAHWQPKIWCKFSSIISEKSNKRA